MSTNSASRSSSLSSEMALPTQQKWSRQPDLLSGYREVSALTTRVQLSQQQRSVVRLGRRIIYSSLGSSLEERTPAVWVQESEIIFPTQTRGVPCRVLLSSDSVQASRTGPGDGDTRSCRKNKPGIRTMQAENQDTRTCARFSVKIKAESCSEIDHWTHLAGRLHSGSSR